MPEQTLTNLNLDQAAFPAGLAIELPVSHLDGAWEHSTPGTQATEWQTLSHTRQQAAEPVAEGGSEQAPGNAAQKATITCWQAVYLADASQPDQLKAQLERAGPDDLVIIQGGDYAHPQLVIDTPAEVLLLKPTQVRELQVTQTHTLTIQGPADALEKLVTSATRISCTDCCQLQALHPVAVGQTWQKVQLRNCHGQQLTVTAPCQDLSLVHCNYVELNLAATARLRAHNCRQVKLIQTPEPSQLELSGMVSAALIQQAHGAMTERIIRDNLGDIHDPEDPALQAILRKVPDQVRSREVHQGLLVLRRALELGVPVQLVWQLRCQLNGNHLRRHPELIQDKHLHRARTQWRWCLTGDGQWEIWQVDFWLWLQATQAGIISARTMAAAVVGAMSRRRPAMWACAQMLRTTPQNLEPKLWAGLFRALKRLLGRQGSQQISTEQSVTTLLLHSALRAFEPRNDPAEKLTSVHRELIHLVVCCYPIDQVIASWPRLMALNPGITRAALLQESQRQKHAPPDLLATDEPLSSQYLKLALAQPPKDTRRAI